MICLSPLLSSPLFSSPLLSLYTASLTPSNTYLLITAADAGSEDKKRKRGEAAAGDIIMHVSKSLDSCTGVLHRAGTLYKGDKHSLLLRLLLLLLLLFLFYSALFFFFLFDSTPPIILSYISYRSRLVAQSSSAFHYHLMPIFMHLFMLLLMHFSG